MHKKRRKNEEIWIINDNEYQAGDNGEYFFRYLMHRNLKEINAYFAIGKDCDDYRRLKQLGNILDIDSVNYLDIFLKSDKIITSTSDSWVINPFGSEQKYIRDIFHFDIIFIPSGIIKDDLSFYLNRFNKNFNLFITSSKSEYNSILSNNYGYCENNVKLTGLSRYDHLFEIKSKIKKEKLILVFPTWRNNIKGTRDLVTHKPIHSSNFINTNFYRFYNDLINNQKLLLTMKKYSYKGIFCLHPYFSEQSEDFIHNECFSIYSKCNDQELLIRASLFVTDYSSLFSNSCRVLRSIFSLRRRHQLCSSALLPT